MGTFLKRYLKYMILAILFIVTIAVTGIMTLNDIIDTEERKSSYTRTQFDYFISSPDAAQVQEIESDPSVERVFPYYALNRAFTQDNATKEIFLLLSDDMQDSEISLFTKRTCIEGSYDKNGAMLDRTAAEALGVEVGDKLSFTILGTTFTRRVSAIYLPSSYGTLTKGIVLTDFTQDIAKVYAPRTYNAAFITARDKNGVKALLKDYVGEGNIALSFEDFVRTQIGSKPPYQSQEEYDARCQSEYAAYRESTLEAAQRGGGQVADKEESYKLLQDKINTTEKNIQKTTKMVALWTAVVFTLVGVIFVLTNIKDDRLRCEWGTRYSRLTGGYALTFFVTVVAAALISFIILCIHAASSFFFDILLSTICYFALPVLAAAPVLLIFVLIYAWILYAKHA